MGGVGVGGQVLGPGRLLLEGCGGRVARAPGRGPGRGAELVVAAVAGSAVGRTLAGAEPSPEVRARTARRRLGGGGGGGRGERGCGGERGRVKGGRRRGG